MRRLIFPVLFLAVIFQACSSNGMTVNSVPVIEPSSYTPGSNYSVGFAWFYKPPKDELLLLLPKYFDFFILTHKDEEERDVLRSMGVSAPISNYLLFTEIHNPGDCETIPRGNQVAYLPGDFCRISNEHPDWFLLDVFGNRIEEDGYYNMDPGNPGYQAFWLERAIQMQEQYGWQGVFIDNVEASLSKYLQAGSLPAKYPTDESFQAAAEDFLRYLHDSKLSPVYANIISIRDEDVWLRYLEYLDGAMLENFAVDWLGGELSSSEWVSEMNMLIKSQNMNKKLILVAQGDQDDLARQRFAYASYLLVNDGLAYFRYSHHSAYREIWLYDNYDLDLGVPLGDMYYQNGSWLRNFEFGTVSVNLATQDAVITLK